MKPSDVLSLAIKKEMEAHDLYTNVAQRTDNPAAKTLLEELAAGAIPTRAGCAAAFAAVP